MPLTPEQQARRTIDARLTAAGWVLQDIREANTAAAQGVAIRAFPVGMGMDRADALLERIRAEKAASAATAPKRNPRRTAKPEGAGGRKTAMEAG